MKNRLIFIVEGDSEVDFVENKLLPYYELFRKPYIRMRTQRK